MDTRRLWPVAVVALLIAAGLSVAGVWTGDVRWHYTALLLASATAVVGMVVGAARWPL